MIGYHGFYYIVRNSQISFSRDALDFGKGFYVTKIKEQAINWTNKFKKKGKKRLFLQITDIGQTHLYIVFYFSIKMCFKNMSNKFYRYIFILIFRRIIVSSSTFIFVKKHLRPNEV